ncbi:polysaccharide deacetylase family protein [Pedobacter cryophilus]|uniref:polysaccharide deacetylase family protein n=1 Tax=Pedobacter cryophilus TaxID=2571271 RepID=UPI00145CFD55|nr:polysaccharide deacetylase family protein [Pedobacter cryophilus]
MSNQKLLLPFYHTVSDFDLPHIQNLYQVKSTLIFKRELDYICKSFKSIPIEDAVSLNDNKKRCKEAFFHLSFDDGLKEIRTVVAPILLEKGIHATFFINPSFLDNKELFYRFKVSLIINQLNKGDSKGIEIEVGKILKSEFLNFESKLLSFTWNERHLLDEIAQIVNLDFNEYLKREPYLDTDDVLWLKEKGFSIGAHSENHPRYVDISLEEQIQQTNCSLQYLKDNFNVNRNYFAFPFSDSGVGSEYFNHYDLQPSINFGTGGFREDKYGFSIQRIPLEVGNYGAEEIIKMQYLKLIIRKILRNNKINR